MPLKYRVLTIIGLCLVSVWFLFPRNVTRARARAGRTAARRDRSHVFRCSGASISRAERTSRSRSTTRKQTIPADKKAEAIDRALKTVRSRIEGFGVSEAVVQKQGNDRIVVQIPGIQDPERARKLVEEQAFLEFKITDKTQALERALPQLDQVIKQRGLAAKDDTGAARPRPRRTRDCRVLLTSDGHGEEGGHDQEGRRRRRRIRPPRPIRSRCSRAARSRACSSRADARRVLRRRRARSRRSTTIWPTPRCTPRCRRARTSSPGTDSTSAPGQVVSHVLPRRLQADHHRRLPHEGAVRTRARPTERSSSSS